MIYTISRQFKEMLKQPFCKVRNGSKLYAGRYLDGKAHYYYEDSCDSRVYEGSFYYLGKYYYHPYGKTIDYVRGSFLHNSKHGRWKFHHKRRGSNRVLYVDYSEGRHNGLYKFRSTGVHNLKSTNVLLCVEMSDGHLCGAVTGNFSGEILTGRCDEQGRPDGTWMMDLSKTSQCRIDYEIWDHGRLVDAYTVDMSTGDKTHNEGCIQPFLKSFIYYDCLPLERLIDKGSILWRGNFKVEDQ